MISFLLLISLILAINVGSLAMLGEAYLFPAEHQTVESQDKPVVSLLILHGFNPTYSQILSSLSVKPLQDSLAGDLGYVDKGLVSSKTSCQDLRSDGAIIARVAYAEPPFKIEQYADEVNKTIEKILECTGSAKIDIVAHSMGGIVARSADNPAIRKIIFVGTPNSGDVYRLGSISVLANEEFSDAIPIDFSQITKQSRFIEGLNDHQSLKDAQIYAVQGDIDGKGDGLVRTGSVDLTEEIDGLTVSCRHFFLKIPTACPKAYGFIVQSLIEE